jgi:type I restriction enzyme R subunit
VSQYSYEESVTDGVNVPHEVYTIETKISKKGNVVKAGWFVDRRDKLTRKKRWQQEDEDTEYNKNDLDKKVVNKSQIRTIIREFRKALETEIFPNRINEKGEYEVPKTLIFAKTDSHADDIIKIVREEFDEGNDFCKKITYKIDEDPKSLINRFRNSYYPRIAVTVDMIATGTDIKPLEVLLFMRDVKSVNYFEQMKGRGTRSIDKDSLMQVSRTAVEKTHFVIVDAVGATKSKKTDSRPLERKHSIPLKDLLGAITMGVKEEDLFLSLANRLIRLERQITDKEKEKLLEYSGGKNLKQITKELINAFDPDAIESRYNDICKDAKLCVSTMSPAERDYILQQAHQELIQQAASTFNGQLNEYIENVRKEHEQIIDHINLDKVTKSEWDKLTTEKAYETIKDFNEYLEKNKDEIQALSIFYNQPYNRRNITFKMIKEVMEKIKMEKPLLAPDYVWNAYAIVDNLPSDTDIQTHNIAEKIQTQNIAGDTQTQGIAGDVQTQSIAGDVQTQSIAGDVQTQGIAGNVQTQSIASLTKLISLIRRACGIDKQLKPFDKTINENFQNWIFKQNAGKHNRFTPEQMDWLRMIKDHVVSSYHIEIEDLDYTPFDALGGRGKMYQLFGNEMNDIINELNEVLAA